MPAFLNTKIYSPKKHKEKALHINNTQNYMKGLKQNICIILMNVNKDILK